MKLWINQHHVMHHFVYHHCKTGVKNASLKQSKCTDASGIFRLGQATGKMPKKKSPRSLLPGKSQRKPAAKKQAATKVSSQRARPRKSPQ